jgi:hypothetical protein
MMKSAVFVAAFLFAVSCASAKSEWDDLESLLQNLDDLDGPKSQKSAVVKEPVQQPNIKESGSYYNPCEDMSCGWGKECILSKNGEPSCECIRQCPPISAVDPFDEVCSTQNETFSSLCDLYRERCLCKRDELGCKNPKHARAHLEYLGACKALEICTADMMAQFGERMADWLFHTMVDMKKRQALNGDQWLEMLHEAEEDDHLKHVYPVLWKFCDLDTKPHDRAVTKHELIPITAPVIPMESCIQPFLAKCDVDNDENISLTEWGDCLGLNSEEIMERC